MQFTVVSESGMRFKFLVFRIQQTQREKYTSFSLWEVGGVARLGSACSLWREAARGQDLQVECPL